MSSSHHTMLNIDAHTGLGAGHVIILTLTWGVDPGLGAGSAHCVRHLLSAHVLALHHDGGRQRGVTEPPEKRIY